MGTRRVSAGGVMVGYQQTAPQRRVSALGIMVAYASMPTMTLEESLWWYLTRESGQVQALVRQRVYPTQAPQTETDYPMVITQRISGPRLDAHDGPSTFATGRFQLTITDRTYYGAKAVRDQLRAALQGYRGTMGASASRGGTYVHQVEVENEIDGWGQTGRLYTVRMDIVIYYRES